jgi:hypothetical protein
MNFYLSFLFVTSYLREQLISGKDNHRVCKMAKYHRTAFRKSITLCLYHKITLHLTHS